MRSTCPSPTVLSTWLDDELSGGESQAVRQMLGHRDLPAFVGDINRAPYVPEAPA